MAMFRAILCPAGCVKPCSDACATHGEPERRFHSAVYRLLRARDRCSTKTVCRVVRTLDAMVQGGVVPWATAGHIASNVLRRTGLDSRDSLVATTYGFMEVLVLSHMSQPCHFGDKCVSTVLKWGTCPHVLSIKSVPRVTHRIVTWEHSAMGVLWYFLYFNNKEALGGESVLQELVAHGCYPRPVVYRTPTGRLRSARAAGRQGQENQWRRWHSRRRSRVLWVSLSASC
jgi:hypothetical protein